MTEYVKALPALTFLSLAMPIQIHPGSTLLAQVGVAKCIKINKQAYILNKFHKATQTAMPKIVKYKPV